MPAAGTTSPLGSLHAKRAASARWGTSDHEEIARDYAAAKLEDYVKRAVESAPPLTDEQRHRIAALLRPAGGAPDAA